jgi:lysosomal acid lipase/cholesteryl ester hydrolase
VLTYNAARLCGLGRLLDWVHSHVSALQSFALHLGEDAELQPPDARSLIEAAGWHCEEHTCETSDGYILGLQRIIPPPGSSSGDFRPPVLMVHGLMQCSEALLTSASRGGAAQAPALPYALAAAGYDVWLGNVRGTRYSRQHVALSAERDDAYWAFSLDELAR